MVVDHRLPGTVVPRPGRVRQLVGGGKAYVLAAFAPMQLAWVDFSPGFDDFLVEPFSGMQVAARTRQLRWRENHTEAAELLKVGDLLINTASCEVTLQGVALSLTYQEYERSVTRRATGGASSPANSSSASCGATTTTAAPAPSTCTSGACAPSSARSTRS